MTALPRPLLLLAPLGFYGAYLFSMVLAGAPLVTVLDDAAVNVAALFLAFLIAAALLDVVRPWRWPMGLRIGFHIAAAIGFAYLWYALVLGGFSLGADWISDGLSARAFSQNALVWQLHQGVLAYALLLVTRGWGAERMARAAAVGDSDPGAIMASNHLLLREGKEMVRIDHDDVVRVSGAGDYVEVVTRTGTHLSSHSLGWFEDALPGALRAHRSHLVPLGAIVRSEPAGSGKLTLHLVNGEDLVTSREGGRRLRALVK
ncbi:LytR/AlgR family response regulator transcription factor [Sphingomicrobium arenosum]|uniref:LytR/AlgR family response regulator transcription factor n=1 Tax=Sphingomicrobium arenosum TaxID=2233861 RepID=UPI002240EAF6|nr:LytTR family DNA-binding domain-containing protein [Sphingomicrobium arenosum]